MTYRELYLLRPWIDAGVGVAVDEPPALELVRKRYLEAVEGGYALTERGQHFVDRIEQFESQKRERAAVRRDRVLTRRQHVHLDSPEGEHGEA